MKLTLLPAVLCWSTLHLASAATPEAHVYIYDPQSQEPRPDLESRSLSPAAARVVLAQRAGVEDYHSADLHNADVIRAINDFGVRTSLFTQQQQQREAGEIGRAILFVESDLTSKPREDYWPYFTISPSPSLSSAKELLGDLESQASAESVHRNSRPVLFMSYGPDLHAFNAKFRELGQRGDVSITVLVLPPPTEQSKQETETPAWWGTYSMPGGSDQLLHKRQAPKEKPLEQGPGIDQDFQPIPSFPAANYSTSQSSPLPGILPACFPTLSTCASTTRNCTGHGSCQLAYTDFSQDPGKECWSCSCSATVSKSSDGKDITTNWGGPACQKRDVSVQFWLIVSLIVGLVGLVSFAVGQVWSMGDEELPSVIGAGVSGPSARR